MKRHNARAARHVAVPISVVFDESTGSSELRERSSQSE